MDAGNSSFRGAGWGKLYFCHRFGARSLLLEFMTIEDSAFFSFGLWYYELQCPDVEDEDKASL